MTLTAKDLADSLARHAGYACHGFNRHALPGQINDLEVECLAQLSAIPLDALRAGQGGGIDRPRRRQRTPQTWHFRTYCSQERRRGILEQMPAVGHLLRLRRRLTGGCAIARTTVPTDYLYLRVLA